MFWPEVCFNCEWFKSKYITLRKTFSSDNGVSVYIMYSHKHWLLHKHTKTETLCDELIYFCIMNAKYLCICLKKI